MVSPSIDPANADGLEGRRAARVVFWRAFARLLEKAREGALPPCAIGAWTAAHAADAFMKAVGGMA